MSAEHFEYFESVLERAGIDGTPQRQLDPWQEQCEAFGQALQPFFEAVTRAVEALLGFMDVAVCRPNRMLLARHRSRRGK